MHPSAKPMVIAALFVAAALAPTQAKSFDLGAGDALGRAVFNHYTAVVEARQASPIQAARAVPRPTDTEDNWTVPAPMTRWSLLLFNDTGGVIRVDMTGQELTPVIRLQPQSDAGTWTYRLAQAD